MTEEIKYQCCKCQRKYSYEWSNCPRCKGDLKKIIEKKWVETYGSEEKPQETKDTDEGKEK